MQRGLIGKNPMFTLQKFKALGLALRWGFPQLYIIIVKWWFTWENSSKSTSADSIKNLTWDKTVFSLKCFIIIFLNTIWKFIFTVYIKS